MVLLSLDGCGFAIECDPDWEEFLEQLWQPFLVEERPTDAIKVGITSETSGWHLTFPDYEAHVIEPWILALVLRTGISARALRRSVGFFGMHASVAILDNLILLIAGPARAGKTTLMLNLLQEGWTYGSDDVAPVSLATGEVKAAPKPIHVREPGRWQGLIEQWAAPKWVPPPTNEWLVPASVFGRRRILTVSPTHVVFPHFHPDSEPRYRQISLAEGMALCGAEVQAGRPTAATLRGLRSMCSGARMATLRYSSTEQCRQLLENILD